MTTQKTETMSGDLVSLRVLVVTAVPSQQELWQKGAAMASVPESMLIGLTSVYARRGETWRIFERHFGQARISSSQSSIFTVILPSCHAAAQAPRP